VRWCAPLIVVFAGLGVASPASADPGSGGIGMPDKPAVTAAACGTGEAWACRPGQPLTFTGSGLDDVDRVVFLGGRGRRDDRKAHPSERSSERLTVTLPHSARRGRVKLVTDSAGDAITPRVVRVLRAPARSADAGVPAVAPAPATALPAGQDAVFPIQGDHDLGQSPTNNFGGGRGHGGQDMFAACGTPVVAVRAAKVLAATFDGRGGNYLVLQDATGQSYVYMHLRDRPLVAKGAEVQAGQPVGHVGQTGRASGCHLHFELWTAPGWYLGGKAIDPLPELTRWDAFS